MRVCFFVGGWVDRGIIVGFFRFGGLYGIGWIKRDGNGIVGK